MADWQSLYPEIVTKIFDFVPEERGTCRLVCRSWCHGINIGLVTLNLIGRHVSLVRVHELFPNLKRLQVELPYNTEPYALFRWESLEQLYVRTEWRTVFGHQFKPTKLSLIADLKAGMLQVQYITHSPFSTCANADNVTEETKADWERNWELERSDYTLEDQENNPLGHFCTDMCIKGLEFGLKGAAMLKGVPILHQAFGVDSKPDDWDAEVELVHGITPNTIHVNLPFFVDCIEASCLFDPGVERYVSKKSFWTHLHDEVLAPNTVLEILRRRKNDVYVWDGRIIVESTLYYMTHNCPALLPGIFGYEWRMEAFLQERARLISEGELRVPQT